MNAHGTDHNTPSIKQLKDLLGFVVAIVTEIVTEFFFRLSFDEAKALLQSKGAIAKKLKVALSEVFVMDADEYAAQREYWKNFYQTHFGLMVDFAEVVIPEKPVDGKWRLVFIPQGLTINAAFEAYRGILALYKWGAWKYTNDLDVVISHNVRTAEKSYALWACDEQVTDITVLECLVNAVVHFVETRQHPDDDRFTLCSGSRDVHDRVPSVYWSVTYAHIGVSWNGLNVMC